MDYWFFCNCILIPNVVLTIVTEQPDLTGPN